MSFLKKLLSKDKTTTNDDLIEAIKKDNVKKVKTILPLEDIEKEDSNFKTPLIYALDFSSLNVAKYLIENGATLDETVDNESVISYLIKMDANIEMIKYMHSIGASIESDYGTSILDMALIKASSFEVFDYIFKNFGTKREEGKRYLIHEIADIETMDVKTKAKILEILVNEHGFDINENQSELYIVSRVFNRKDTELLEEIIKLGACVNGIAESLIRLFGYKKLKKLIPYILKYEVNQPKYILKLLDLDYFKEYISKCQSVSDEKILTQITLNLVLHDKEKIELAKLALDKGADINELDDSENPTNVLRNFIAEFAIEKNTLYLDFLLDNGAKIECEGLSAFFQSIIDNDIHLVKHLLEKGADVNFVTYFGNTAVNCVIYPEAKFKNVQERINMLQLLIDYGLDLNIKISHYKDSPTNITPVLEAVVDICEVPLIDFIIDKFPDLEISSRTIKYSINRDDIDIETTKKIIAKDPYVLFEKDYSCEIRNINFDSSILRLAVLNAKEELTNYILDTYPDIKQFSEAYPLALTGIYKKFSINTVKKLIQKEPDINKLYYIWPEEPNTVSLLMLFLNAYSEDFNEEEKFEILEEMLKSGADISIPLFELNASNQSLDARNALVIHANGTKKFESKVVDLFLEHGIDPYKPMANMNESPMHTIINRYRNISDELCVQYLDYFEAKGYKVDLEHKNTMTTDILLGAAMMNRPKTIKWLIDKGANIHTIGGFDNSPALHKAISNYDGNDPILRAQTVKVLIEAGCDTEQIDSEQFTPLMSAANYGCFEAAKVLIEAGADVNFYNEAGENAAHRAILTTVKAYDDPENSNLIYSKILALLKDAGAKLNESSNEVVPPLHLSIIYNKKELFDILLQLELDLNALDMNGNTPIMLAVSHADMYYVNTLMNKNVNLDTINNYNESIHFNAVMRFDQKEGAKMLKYFLDKLPISEGNDGFSLMHSVAYYVNMDAFNLIKDLFNDLNEKNYQGFTPLLWASYSNIDIEESKRVELIKAFVEHGANINERLPDGANALTLAVFVGFMEVANCLIELGCDVQTALNSIKNAENVSPKAIEYLEGKL